MDSKRKSCSLVKDGKIPRIWLQVGKHRTASTLQFVILVLISKILCPGSFYTFLDRITSKSKYVDSYHELDVLGVYKTHSFENILKMGSQWENKWIFVSTESIHHHNKSEFSHIKDKIKFIQPVDKAQTLNSLVSKYGELFNLPNTTVSKITRYIDLWSNLRKCCGPQASKSWRNKLSLGNQAEGNFSCNNWSNLSMLERELEDFAILNDMPKLDFKVGYCECTKEVLKHANVSLGIHELTSLKEMKECTGKYQIPFPQCQRHVPLNAKEFIRDMLIERNITI